MSSASYFRTFANQDEAIEFVRNNLFPANQNLTVIANYQGKTFSFERKWKVDDETQKLIQEKLKVPKREDLDWILEHSRPNIAVISLIAMSEMPNEEFQTLQSKIARLGVVINQVVPFKKKE